jgi:signal transduction histidine kinase
MSDAGLISSQLINDGLFGIIWLKPTALFGLTGLDPITHAFFWSMLFNIGSFAVISVYGTPDPKEIYQAELFVDAFRYNTTSVATVPWRGTAYTPDLTSLLGNFIGAERALNLVNNYAHRNQIQLEQRADPRIVNFSERILAGVIGSASARIMVSSVTKEEELNIDEVLKMVRESQQMIELNKELRKKSTELSKAGEQLRKANEQLKQIDALKDEFLYTVTHELRTPLTSIRSLTEILHDNPDLQEEQRQEFLGAVVKETERLSHLISQVLTLEKYESGKQKLQLRSFDFRTVLLEVLDSVRPLAEKKQLSFSVVYPDSMLLVHADQDLLYQVVFNLVGNAIKFSPDQDIITIHVVDQASELRVAIQDNGKGIEPELQELIFDKFFQARNQTLQKPVGSGLGLAICKRIIEMHNGRIWVESEIGNGSRFIFFLPNFDPTDATYE